MLRSLAALVATYLLLAPAAVLAQGPVRWSGYIQAREAHRDEQGFSASINRARLTASGGGAKDVTWRIQGEFRQGSVGTGRASVALQDAVVRYKPGAFAIQAGQFKTPFAREFITSLADIETADRSTVVDSLAPRRDIGVMAEFAFGSDATVFLGLFNGEGQNVTSNADSNYLVVGRVTGRPVPFLTLGANVADYAGDSTRYGADISIEYRGAIFRGEYVTQNREGIDIDDEGWYAQGAYRVVPWVQLVLKLEDFSRDGISFGSRNNATTGGVNVEFPGGKVRLLLNYVSRETGELGNRTSTVIGQAQVKF
jgi:phosphate-selective porin